ncbi:hypothetical protein A3Q56_05269 [Intoshia linei]|uniref:Ion transport domain-containing protein n=1 Tax=Intoshia linei TaxID=1819745 RepID=A0A177AYD0_9BILA|nr:hypothetical protein A3Q56_05269 [Intoshia linei]
MFNVSNTTTKSPKERSGNIKIKAKRFFDFPRLEESVEKLIRVPNIKSIIGRYLAVIECFREHSTIQPCYDYLYVVISIHFTFNDEKEKAEQEEVDVRTMKILRCLIHNEIVKLPEDYNINNKKIKKILKDIKSVQYALNEYGIVKFLSPHLSKNNSIIIREALALMVKILYMGNRQVQNSYVSYFLGSREENFFFAIKAFLENASIGIKERRSLINQHQQKISEAIADVIRFQSALQTNAKDKMESRKQFKRLESALKNGKLSLNSQKTNYRNPSAMIKNRLKSAKHGTKTSVVPETRAIPKFQLDSGNTGIKRFGLVTAKSKKKVSVNKIAPDDKMKSVNVAVDISTSNDVNRIINMAMENEEILNVANDDYGIELVLKILGLMCDGQNKILQGYLREQPDNIKSVNLIITTSQFMTMLYSSINSYTIIITINLVNTLIEFTSGNYQNQICVFDSKICDHINYILRAEIGNDIDEDKSIELMDSIATLIVSMVENHRSHAYTRDKNKCCVDVLECLDLMALVKIAVKFYENTVPFNTKKDYPESIATSALNAGFKYFYILTRIKELIQLGVIPMKEDFAPCPKIMAALQYYNSKTLSIEILMDGELERVYFKCNDKKVLREDIVSKFKYEVDRTSPTSKLRDLLVWSVDIMDDINYTKRIQRIPIVKLYLQYDFKPTYNYFPIEFGWTFTILAILHNLSTCLVFVGYMILNHPTIRIPSFLRRGSVSKIERVSHLSVRLLGFQTLWHTLLLIMSAMGSIYYGYFFSFHLLHVAQFNQLIKRAIQAVTKNGDSLLWVTLYGVVFLYIYALITFAVYRELKKDEDKMFCNTMYECMLTMMHSGPIGDGVFDFLKSPTILPFNQKFNKAIFDIVFFIIITTIGLNIIFGIIVDTFSELRDNKWHVDNDMKTACFICSRPSYDFEQHSTGFKNHVDNEHNQWSYVFFFIYLNETFENDYTAIELYVHNMIINDSLEFFPLGKSLCFQSEEIAQDQNQIESLKDEIANLTQQLKSMQLIHTK